ncbi:CopD family protein (plasmid) [Qipengyuania citrea]|jgi:hypothetical protein|uniref:CopD family protein n=1 Tax=Qipengyuania citrea TaxID=225971 RepID=A0ABY4UB06_9SPHN|nr:CopD family protein [Qipengyuania citrea]MBX9778245.1 CopD family protein [Xanthobacteraceae bacterium]USA63270.1 CopD family protein [Qipengyuania citrea]
MRRGASCSEASGAARVRGDWDDRRGLCHRKWPGLCLTAGRSRNALVSYGRFLLSKQALFVAMLGLASFDRFRLTPALEYSISAGDHAGALRALRLSRGVETARIVSILALVAWLGTLEPPASAM